MTLDPRYAALFEPLAIGPVVAPNRFYQVPHCTGMGSLMPRTLAAMRGVKAEGGWGVVCTEYCSIHATSDDQPYPYASLWDEDDVRAMGLTAEAVHAHGALAGVELWHGGGRSANLYSRETPLGVDSRPVANLDPLQGRAMDRADIADLRRWHRAAAERALGAGFDLVYVYAAHDYLLARFLDPRHNRRRDEYGPTLAQRVRLVAELIEETREALRGRAAVAVRWSATDPGGAGDERREMFALLAELPDLWDVTIDDYDQEMGVSRFVESGSLEPMISWVKTMTSKPVVSVGRFTSPDAMLAQLRRGVVDLIGAARPSIADPFLPRKIAEGRVEDIRECIGCNICYAGDARGVPIRCTQNPTIGEEWRRDWHPERIAPATRREPVLVVGAGPAGLECARALAERGHAVSLAEAGAEAGGRVSRESRLPGLAEWGRVRDWRLGRIERGGGVEIHLGSRMTADDVLAFADDAGGAHVVIATGSRWRADGLGRHHVLPLDTLAAEVPVLTPDDVMDGVLPAGPVLLYDDDHYYMGPVLAEKLARAGVEVMLVTPAGMAGAWSVNTAEQHRCQRRLLETGVDIVTAHALVAAGAGEATIACVYTGREQRLGAASVLTVTARVPCDDVWQALASQKDERLLSLHRIGDCLAPATIAHAVYSGHRLARELGGPPAADVGFRRERAPA